MHFVQYMFISYIFRRAKEELSNFACEGNTIAEGLMNHIVISKGTELLRVPLAHLMYITSDGNYSNVVTQDGRQRMVSMQLGVLEDLICDTLGDDSDTFLRIGRSLIVNVEFIYFIDTAKQQLILSDCCGSYHELSASRDVLGKLKNYVESMHKK